MTAHKRPSASDIRAALRVLGQAGGSVTSPAKTAAAKRNALKRWADVRAAKAVGRYCEMCDSWKPAKEFTCRECGADTTKAAEEGKTR